MSFWDDLATSRFIEAIKEDWNFHFSESLVEAMSFPAILEAV
jgi:hypothetical protein